MNYSKLLDGKRAVITSGARGIGKAIAKLFAEQGAAVAVGGVNRPALDATIKEIKEISPESFSFYCDLGVKEDVKAFCKEVLDRFGRVDILVNTVGINHHVTTHEVNEEELIHLFEVNYLSGFRCAKSFIPGMIKAGKGSIINISSIHGDMTMPGYMMYASTKGAMNAATRAMALDYAADGIRVNTISPGLIMSDVIKDEVNACRTDEERRNLLDLFERMQPLPPGSMEDIANAALYLASDMSSYVTGQTLFVDGGASIKAH
jgi:NAD(P)-dependent dehydrogenase (short-subunit alcohol dehydrogenase family)